MELSNKTARQMYEELKAGVRRPPFGYGARAALINVDFQRAYTDVGAFNTAYETDPLQLDYVNGLAALCRDLKFPVVWTYCAYLPSGEDCGIWGTRTDTPDSLQNIKYGSERAQLDPRLTIGETDIVIAKRMASAFFETLVPSLLTFHKVDTVIVTGGSTSGCVRATAVDSLASARWHKLVWNIPFNGLGAVLDLSTDQLLEKHGQLVIDLMQETIAIANRLGIAAWMLVAYKSQRAGGISPPGEILLIPSKNTGPNSAGQGRIFCCSL